jgi:hypothetical protein
MSKREPSKFGSSPNPRPSGNRKLEAVAYIDTVHFFFPRRPKSRPAQEWAKFRKRNRGRRVIWKECENEVGFTWGSICEAQQPAPDLIRDLFALGGILCRVDVAVDWSGKDVTAGWLRKRTLLKWRPSGLMREAGELREDGSRETLYWVNENYRRDHDKILRRSNRDLVCYDTRPSKITGEPNVTHLELRFQTADAVRRAGIRSPDDLINLNPLKLFCRYVKVVDFEDEKLLWELTRAQLKEDRDRHMGKEINKHVDRYRSNLRWRIPRIHRTIGHVHLAQKMKDIKPQRIKKLKSISLDRLGVPEDLSRNFQKNRRRPG